MSILDIFAKPAQIQEMKKQTGLLELQLKELRVHHNEVQETLVKDILTLTEMQSSVRGNDYQTYESAVEAISNKYNCYADWGCLHTGIIVDLRAAFILGEGVKISHNAETRDEAERELQWTEDFFSWNDFDAEVAQEMAKEAEIEGKVAIKMIYEPVEYGTDPAAQDEPWPGMVSARFIPWTSKKYEIEADPQDYSYYTKMSWGAGANREAGQLNENEFVYKKFGGRINNPNEAQPKVMRCLTQIDRLDKALRDLREINHLYAAPTPDFEIPADSPGASKQVDDLLKKLTDINWKIGKVLVHTGTFTMKGTDPGGTDNLIKEIEVLLKMISGTTGIPIHFLGLLDLLSNRATGDNTRELVMAATARDRMVWKGVYEELITKSIEMFNYNNYRQMSQGKLDPTRIKVDIPMITQEYWDRIEKVLIPASMGGIISKEHTASQIPGVDMDAEAERRIEREKEEAKQAKQEMDYWRTQAATQTQEPPSRKYEAFLSDTPYVSTIEIPISVGVKIPKEIKEESEEEKQNKLAQKLGGKHHDQKIKYGE